MAVFNTYNQLLQKPTLLVHDQPMENISKQQIDEIFDSLASDSHRSSAILAMSLIDALLKQTILQKLIADAPEELFDSNGPLSTLSGKMHLAWSLGLLTPDEYHDLKILKKIRNLFAHDIDHQMTFDTEAISSRLRSLRIPVNHDSSTPVFINQLLFSMTVYLIQSQLNARISSNLQQPNIPHNYRIHYNE